MYKNYLNNDEILTKITKYELNRADGSIFIEVHELICSTYSTIDPEAKFVAAPSHLLGTIKEAYIFAAPTEFDALSQCLEALRQIAAITDIVTS